MKDIDFLKPERRAVIKNIESALAVGNTFEKVEIGDPRPTDEDIKRVIVPFDNERRAPVSKIKAFMARKLAESFTKKVNKETIIVGLENALCVTGGAIITSNHYNPTDSTPIRILATLMEKRKNLHISIQESNVFMDGAFGFLMKNCNTIPFPRMQDIWLKISLRLSSNY